MRPRPAWLPVLVLAALAGLAPRVAVAQDPLYLVNDSTQVRYVRFRFVDRHALTAPRLRNEMVTQGPDFGDRLKSWFAFLPFVSRPVHPFDPVELQRDMERLRRYYTRNGYLRPSVDYPASQYDASSNRIGVIVTVREGPPLVVSSLDVRLASPLPSTYDLGWTRLMRRLDFGEGDRYTDFERLTAETRIRKWLRDRGYAFADVVGSVETDSSALRSAVTLDVRPGPLARIDSVEVIGVRSVDERVIRRQVPFRPGRRFSAMDLERGQQALFGLDLFRVALVDVPPQPADSTVTVRVRVTEARPRKISTETGYALENGVDLKTTFRHRNFLGDARNLTVEPSWQTGWLARPSEGRSAIRAVLVSATLSQPYILVRKLSGSLSIYHLWTDNPNQQTEYRAVGLAPTLVYEMLPYRTASLRFGFSRAIPVRNATESSIGVYNRSTVTAAVTVGRLNNYLHPRSGWLLRPQVDVAGLFLGELSYTRGTVEATGLVPLSRRSSLALSLKAGRLVPTGSSRDQSDVQNEFRFDDVRYYAGGATDVRGWSLETLGPKFSRADTILVADDGTARAVGATYESVGGLGKAAFSVELRLPMPVLGSKFQFATFLDGGAVGARVLRDDAGRVLRTGSGLPEVDDRRFPALSDFRYGAGMGIRFLTAVGAVRLDAAWKLNPDRMDLERPAERHLFDYGLRDAPPERHPWKRLHIHLSIDRTF